jgi:hypothetical protein
LVFGCKVNVLFSFKQENQDKIYAKGGYDVNFSHFDEKFLAVWENTITFAADNILTR